MQPSRSVTDSAGNMPQKFKIGVCWNNVRKLYYSATLHVTNKRILFSSSVNYTIDARDGEYYPCYNWSWCDSDMTCFAEYKGFSIIGIIPHTYPMVTSHFPFLVAKC